MFELCKQEIIEKLQKDNIYIFFKDHAGFTQEAMKSKFAEAVEKGEQWLHSNTDIVKRLVDAGQLEAIGELCHCEHEAYISEIVQQSIPNDLTLNSESIEGFLYEALISGLDLAMFEALGVSINPIEQ